MTNITTDSTIVPDIEHRAAITTIETSAPMMKLTGKFSTLN
jgi:hypothetical protein